MDKKSPDITTVKRSPQELENLRRAAETWDKPLSLPKPVPKSIPKKRGRPSKNDVE